VLNGRFDALTASEAVEAVADTIASGACGYLCTVNVAILMMMRANFRLQRFVERARWVVADGQPLVWASRLAGAPIPERVTGLDLIDALSARAERDGFGVALLGASDDVVQRASAALLAKYPRLRVCAALSGYFADGEARERVRAISRSGAELLFVGMGVPRQERFIEDHFRELGVNVALGVGGSFEVLAGRRRRAPALAQRMGLEWAFRAAQEPERLLPRYVRTNAQFIWLITLELARAGWRKASKAAPNTAH
jgi:N-acetylglucosaminyldiphosphoundecaprenol N-acetyl-beta-D-mannosaminyltransferase